MRVPIQIVRLLHLGPGDNVGIRVVGNKMIVERIPMEKIAQPINGATVVSP